jgi:hypothetical protein
MVATRSWRVEIECVRHALQPVAVKQGAPCRVCLPCATPEALLALCRLLFLELSRNLALLPTHTCAARLLHNPYLLSTSLRQPILAQHVS